MAKKRNFPQNHPSAEHSIRYIAQMLELTSESIFRLLNTTESALYASGIVYSFLSYSRTEQNMTLLHATVALYMHWTTQTTYFEVLILNLIPTMETCTWPTYFEVSDSRSEEIRQFWYDLMELGEDRSENDGPSALTLHLSSCPTAFWACLRGPGNEIYTCPGVFGVQEFSGDVPLSWFCHPGVLFRLQNILQSKGPK